MSYTLQHRIDGMFDVEFHAPEGYDRQYLMPRPLPDDRQIEIDSLALDISGHCNMACRYCAEASTQPAQRQEMSTEQLPAILSILKAQHHRAPSLRFGSGEPMLNRKFLHELQEQLDEAFPQGSTIRPQVFITTNGTLLEEHDIEWLASTGWYIKASLDGPASVHDRWRILPGGVPTHAQVAAIVSALSRRIPDKFSVTAVLAAGNDPGEVFGAIEDLGVRRIELVPAAHKLPSIHPGAADIDRFRAFVEGYVDRLVAGETGVPVLVRFSNRVSRAMGYDNCFIQCGAGRNFFGVDHRGAMYPCFRFIGIEHYRTGTLAEAPDTLATVAFRQQAGRSWDQRSTCNRCWAAPLCGGPCFAVTELFGPGNGEPLKLHCLYTLIESRGAWRLVETLRRQDPLRLLEYLPETLRNYAKESCSGQTT